jgi:hypothetical protein
MTRFVRARGTPLWLAVYTLGLLCVFSFVLFEVLDVDGSDFAVSPSRLSIKPAEVEHADVRRIVLVVAVTPVAILTAATLAPPPSIGRRPDRLRHVPLRVARIPRASLARALLSDVSPSA